MKTEPGRAFKVVGDIREWASGERDGKAWRGDSYEDDVHALEAWVVSGEYDVIMKAEAKTVRELFKMITKIVKYSQNSPGDILSTRTYVASDGIWK
jgi:hypothetical protein